MNIKKVLCFLIIITLCVSILTSCSNKKTENGNAIFVIDDNITFVKVKESSHFELYVHKETKVIYIATGGTSNVYQGGITPLVDENGNPILYEGEV